MLRRPHLAAEVTGIDPAIAAELLAEVDRLRGALVDERERCAGIVKRSIVREQAIAEILGACDPRPDWDPGDL